MSDNDMVEFPVSKAGAEALKRGRRLRETEGDQKRRFHDDVATRLILLEHGFVSRSQDTDVEWRRVKHLEYV